MTNNAYLISMMRRFDHLLFAVALLALGSLPVSAQSGADEDAGVDVVSDDDDAGVSAGAGGSESAGSGAVGQAGRAGSTSGTAGSGNGGGVIAPEPGDDDNDADGSGRTAEGGGLSPLSCSVGRISAGGFGLSALVVAGVGLIGVARRRRRS